MRVMTQTFKQMWSKARESGTQAELARALGVTQAMVSHIDLGRRLPSKAIINRLCSYLDVHPAERKEWHRAAARACGWEV